MKNLLNLGKVLNRQEQQQIQGGNGEDPTCYCWAWSVDSLGRATCTRYQEVPPGTPPPLAAQPIPCDEL